MKAPSEAVHYYGLDPDDDVSEADMGYVRA